MKHLFNLFAGRHKKIELPTFKYQVFLHCPSGHPNEYGLTVNAHDEEGAKHEAAAIIAHIGWFPGAKSEEETASRMIIDSVTMIE